MGTEKVNEWSLLYSAPFNSLMLKRLKKYKIEFKKSVSKLHFVLPT